MEQVLHMNGGKENESYAQNSKIQRSLLLKANHALQLSVQEFCQENCMILSTAECIRIADLGCASGPNSLLAVGKILASIDKECHDLNILKLPNIQVFLNDLTSNDFNSIFKSLPIFYEELEESCGRGPGSCFVAAMPGSFHGRLFPDNSMHFIHSSIGLHWLSQVPSGLVTEEGLPLNKGNIYIGKTSPRSVLDAYLLQFDKDFTNFLSARADELVPGGHLFVTLPAKLIDDPVLFNAHDLLGVTMNGMVKEGLIEGKALDSFNIPHYLPSVEEVTSIIEKTRAFKVRYSETIQLQLLFGWEAADPSKVDNVFGANDFGKYRACGMRAMYEPIFKAHFGDSSVIDNIFTKLAANINISLYQGKMNKSINSLIVSMSKL